MSAEILAPRPIVVDFADKGGTRFTSISADAWGDGWHVHLASTAPVGERRVPENHSMHIQTRSPGLAAAADALAWLQSTEGAAWRSDHDAAVARVEAGGR